MDRIQQLSDDRPDPDDPSVRARVRAGQRAGWLVGCQCVRVCVRANVLAGWLAAGACACACVQTCWLAGWLLPFVVTTALSKFS